MMPLLLLVCTSPVVKRVYLEHSKVNWKRNLKNVKENRLCHFSCYAPLRPLCINIFKIKTVEIDW